MLTKTIRVLSVLCLTLGCTGTARPEPLLPSVLDGAESLEVVLLDPPEPNWTAGRPASTAGIVQEVYDQKKMEQRRQTVRSAFVGARWDFQEDGSLHFAPPPTADVRDDLYPFAGRWARSGDLVEIHAQRRSPLGAGLSLDGFLSFSQGAWHLDALFAVVSGPARRVTWLRQLLSPGAPARTERFIEGLPIPAEFEVTIIGRSGETDLPPRPAVLRLRPPEAGTASPLSLVFETATQDALGDTSWLAPVTPAGARGIRTAVTAKGGNLTVEVEASPDAALAPTWVGPAGAKVVGDLPTPFNVTRGTLRVTVQGQEVTGEIKAEGTLLFDPSRKVSYQGHFRGTRRDPAAVPSVPPVVVEAAPKAPPEGWELAVSLSGSTENGPFSGLSGTFFVLPQGVDQYTLSLTTEGSARNGWISLSGPLTGGAVARGEWATFEAQVDVEQATNKGQISWSPGAPDGGAISLARKITLRFRIIDQKTVEGEIHGEGFALADGATSRYDGKFTGQVRLNERAESLRASLTETRFDGAWTWEDGAGSGALEISHEEARWKAVLTHQGEPLRFTGHSEGDRIEFEASREGSKLFLRALPGSELLIGFWRTPKPIPLQPVVARRRLQPATPSNPGSLGDAGALRLLGGDPFAKGDCVAARQPLAEAVAIYRREIDSARSKNEQLGISASMALAVNRLLSCDLSLKDHRSFLADLQSALEGLRLLRSDELARAALADRSAQIKHDLTFHQGLLEKLANLFASIRKSPEKMPSNSSLASCEAAVASIRNSLGEQLTAIEAIESETQAGRLPPQRALADLEAREQETQKQVQEAWMAVDSAATALAKRDPEVLETFGALQIPLVAESSVPDLGAMGLDEKEKLFHATLKKSRILNDSEKELLFQAKKTSLLLHTLAGVFQVAGAYALKEPDFGTMAVETAMSLARSPDLWLGSLRTDEAKRQALTELETFFEKLIFLLLDDGQATQALAVAETARTRAFVDLLESRDEVRASLDEFYRRTDDRTIPNPTSADSFPLEDLLSIVRRRGGVTVEYFMGSNRLAIFVVSPRGEVRAVTATYDPKALKATVEAFREHMERWQEKDRDGKETERLSQLLHRWLVAPIPAGSLPDDPDTTVTIIPYKDLFQVPFGILEDESGSLLIERHSLVYSPSIAVLRFTRENRDRLPAGRKPSLLALVNPSPMPFRDAMARYPSLQETESLFPEITKFYMGQTTILTGEKASKQALFASSEKASVLQLVTHAQFDPHDPLSSYIALSANPKMGDGYLRVPEVFRLRLNTELIILWACQTGLGGLSPDGVEGFSRAFTWAGAPSLMASLWSIPQGESFELMYSFHGAWLRRHRTKAQALRDAMVEHARQDRRNPWRWGGFVLYGEGD